MRKRIFSVITISIAVVTAACVGDEPATSSGSDQDASTNDATSNDGGADSAIPVDSGVDSGNFTPASLPNLALWLDDTSIDLFAGDEVAKWQDKSGKQNDALAPSDAGAAIPLVISAGIGGRPTVHFDGVQTYLYIPDAPTLRWGTGAFMITVVERSPALDSGNTAGTLFGKTAFVSPNVGPELYLNLFYPPYAASATGATSGAGDAVTGLTDGGLTADQPHILRFRWVPDTSGTGGTLELSVDGAIKTARLSAPDDVSANGVDAVIGATANNHAFPFEGDIVSVIAANGATSDADMVSLDAYLKARYGL